jgi:hypothetical protein
MGWVTPGTLRGPRPARAGDYDAIAAVVDTWWGRPVVASLPRLFFDHFHRSSLVIDGSGGPVAFLAGILSPSQPDRSVGFHRALGFGVTGPVTGYNSPGRDMIVFERAL